MQMPSLLPRALRLGLAAAVIVLVAAACSSSGTDDAAEPEAQATPTEASATPSAEAESPTDPDAGEIPTVDAEAALAGIDTTTPPPEGYCDASTYFASAAFGEEFRVFLDGGDASQQAGENIDQQMTSLVELAPPDLVEDARLVTEVVTEYIEQVSDAVANDDFVDATALQERFAEIADSGERLAAYDEVVCGNPPPGSDPA